MAGVVLFGLAVSVGWAQTPDPAQRGSGVGLGPVGTQAGPGQKGAGTGTKPAGVGAEAGKAGEQGGGSKSASGTPSGLPSTAPAAPPAGPMGRRRIGLALGGGGALALTEIGSLEWLEEHHIPVDMIAGTSMGSLVGGLYATGTPVSALEEVMNDEVFSAVFRIQQTYTSRSFRRREDSRDLPNALTIGLKHGVSFRNSVLTDQGLNSFLDKEFLRYDDQTDFNTLPIPFRCIATDLNASEVVTFVRGSLPDAVRASVSLPGVYRPFELQGHEYVDGGVLENLPTRTVREMKADVVLAVSLPLAPVSVGQLDSILGVVQRSFSVAIEANERASRKLADVVMMPDISGYTAADYLKTKDLARRGYEAAEREKAALLPYALDEAEWAQYVAERKARQRGPAATLLAVKVQAPNDSVTRQVERLFAAQVNQAVDTKKVEGVLADIRADGRYDADYTVGYEAKGDRRPILLVTVQDKKTGPPFLLLGANVAAQTSGVSRATLEGILLDQDLGGYGSELRTRVKVGYVTEIGTEYFRTVPNVLGIERKNVLGTMFVAPRFDFARQPFQIYSGGRRIAERLLQTTGGGADVGWTNQRSVEVRAGWEENDIRWREQIGVADGLPDVAGSMQRARVRFALDTQDKGLVPQFGRRLAMEGGYLYKAAGSVDAPRFATQYSMAHMIGKEIFVAGVDAGTMLERNVGQPYRFTLGGPLHLSASATDEYRGTDYFLVQPAVLRRVASLPAVLGQSIYAGLVYEAGQMRAPDQRTVTRQDVFLGLVGETPLGVITIGPAVGDGGRYKLVFTLGKLF